LVIVVRELGVAQLLRWRRVPTWDPWSDRFVAGHAAPTRVGVPALIVEGTTGVADFDARTARARPGSSARVVYGPPPPDRAAFLAGLLRGHPFPHALLPDPPPAVDPIVLKPLDEAVAAREREAAAEGFELSWRRFLAARRARG
jgi:hypothetical protein